MSNEIKVGDYVYVTEDCMHWLKEGDIAEVKYQDRDGDYWVKALVKPVEDKKWCTGRDCRLATPEEIAQAKQEGGHE